MRYWRRTIFSDEKRFNLDRPDVAASFWADKRLLKATFLICTNGGAGVMVWAAISWRGKTPFIFLDNKLNAALCIQMLQAHLEPFMEEHYPNGCVFQQDGAPAHSAKFTRDYFADAEITDMSWAPNSLDMNCIENLWGELAMTVYGKGRQFDDIEELKEAMFYAWDSIDLATVRNLISSMPRRVITLYNKRGYSTKYYEV